LISSTSEPEILKSPQHRHRYSSRSPRGGMSRARGSSQCGHVRATGSFRSSLALFNGLACWQPGPQFHGRALSFVDADWTCPWAGPLTSRRGDRTSRRASSDLPHLATKTHQVLFASSVNT
jgi:hypothetical protein